MQRASLNYSNLEEKDFLLRPAAQSCLPGTKAKDPELYIGLPHWKSEDWKDRVYPALTRGRDTLRFYSQQFNTVELVATRHAIFEPAQFISWQQTVGKAGFKFCPLFPDQVYLAIKHGEANELTNQFLDGVALLQPHLGPLIFHLGQEMYAKHPRVIIEYLKHLPTGNDVFFHHFYPALYDAPAKLLALENELKVLQKGWLIEDHPYHRSSVHLRLTIPKTIIRFICDGNNPLDIFRIQQWKSMLAEWYDKGLEECYFFIHVSNKDAELDFTEFVKSELETLTAPSP